LPAAEHTPAHEPTPTTSLIDDGKRAGARTDGRVLAPSDEADLQTRLLHLAFAAMPETLGLTVLAVPPFAVLLWPLFGGRAKEFWALALLASIVMQAAVLWAWRQRGAWQNQLLGRWRGAFAAMSTLAGLAWGLGPCLLFAQADASPSVLLVGILFLVCAVVNSSQAAQPWAMVGFIVAALLPPALAAWWAPGDVNQVAAILLAAGMLTLIVVGWRSGLAVRSLQLAQSKLNASLAETSAARRAAESASRAKTRFLANMSHELRTPLNAVIGAAQLLRAEDGPGRGQVVQQSHLVDAIQRGGNNLLGLVENVLDLSRIEAGEMPLHVADFHLVECIEAALSTGALVGRSKGLKLACIIDPHLGAWRRGDAVRLRQVVLNLLGNAVKFTDAGEVLVRVTAGDERHGEDSVRIVVSDTGVGISEDALQHIFEPFRQAEEQASRRFGGSGLGLAIAQQLVVAMGGSLHAESRLGQGSSFEIELPLPPAHQVATEQPPSALRVAYLESHEPSAEALCAHLKRLGCEALRFTDALALRTWLSTPADGSASWVLMAADAPHCDAITEQVLDVLDLSHLVLMADDGTGLADHARVGQGLSRQLLRPITRTALVSALQPRVLNSEPAVLSDLPQDLMSPTQLQGLTHVLVVEDDELNRDIVSGLLQHGGFRVTVARDGPEGLQALRASGRVDLVLMDWQMPGMDGLEATRLMRAGAAGTAGQTVPIVALTANAFAEDRAACLAAGMNDFLTKPVLAEKLYGTVRRWATQRSADNTAGLSAPRQAQAAAPASLLPAPVFDPQVLNAMPMVASGEAPDLVPRLLTLYLSGAHKLLLRGQQAQLVGDDKALRHALHELKSSSGMVGALHMQALAAAQEQRLRQGQAIDTDAWGRIDLALQSLHAQLAQAHPSTSVAGPSPGAA
jgi:two-component system, sensor histidine kinase and response regulator